MQKIITKIKNLMQKILTKIIEVQHYREKKQQNSLNILV